MSVNAKFYSRYFKKTTFLSYKDDSLYVQEPYLTSIGLLDTSLYAGKRVLDIGVGSGRFTIPLRKNGLMAQASEYVVVEPSEGIQVIKSYISLPNVRFLKCSLEDLRQHVDEASFDTVIAYGVIPHISEPLENIAKRLSSFVKEEGTLAVQSSYHGERSISYWLHNLCEAMPILKLPVAFLCAILQHFFASRETSILHKFWIKNLIFSFQSDFWNKYKKFHEYYSINPYNIHYNYSKYLEEFSKFGMNLVRLFPHSICFFLKKSPVGIKIPSLDGKRVCVFGDQLTKEILEKNNPDITFDLTRSIVECANYEVVVIGYDFTIAEPFYTVANELESSGMVFGKQVFIYQMFV